MWYKHCVKISKHLAKGNKSYSTKDKELRLVKYDTTAACLHWKAEQVYIKSKCRHSKLLDSKMCWSNLDTVKYWKQVLNMPSIYAKVEILGPF